MDTKIDLVTDKRVACYEGNITIRHDPFDNTEDEDYTFSGANQIPAAGP